MHRVSSINDIPEDIKPTVLYVLSMFDEIYLVGGAVRDVIIRLTTKDLDFSTPIGSRQVQEILHNNNIKTRDTGIDYGTVSFNLDGFDIQITTFREEYYELGSRRPSVSYSADIDSDLSRRDFSINAIALSRDKIIDPYDGLGDINKKIIKAVGDPSTKFKDDPLRILRAFRFVSQLGYNITDETLQAAITLRSNLGIVSTERIGLELQKLISGEYWDDALYEIADAKILDSVFKILGITFSVSGDDVSHELSIYTTDQLCSMSNEDRWALFMEILDFSRGAAGVQSVDIQTLADKVLTAFQLPKPSKDAISLNLSSLRKTREVKSDSSVPTRTPEEMLKEGTRQKEGNDPRWMISLATYNATIGKSAISSSQYKKARKHLEESLKISQENYNYIINTFSDRPEEKRDKLKGLSVRVRDRLRYSMLAEVFDDRLYSKYKSSDELINFLVKKYKNYNISVSDLRSTAEYVLASTYRRSPHPLTIEPFLEYLDSDDLLMDKDDIRRYRRGIIEDKIRDKSILSKEKAGLYLQKAEIAKSAATETNSRLGFEYYDPYIDYLYNSMVSADSLSDFNKIYDEFVDSASEYLKLSDEWGRYYDGKRNMYLTSASALVYAIQLSDDVSTRLKISKTIVDDYKEARSLKNRMRYMIYVDWFSFVDKLFDSDGSKESLRELCAYSSKLDSIGYKDDDEAYLSQYRADIVRKRALLQDTALAISVIIDSHDAHKRSAEDKVISSMLTLLKTKLIDRKNSFNILKNYLAAMEKEINTLDKIEIPERSLKRNLDDVDEIQALLTGESETLEYKSTWKFDLNSYRYKNEIKNDDSIKHEVMKNIAGMMNKNGGAVVIGVEDDGTVCGLESGDFMLQSSPDPRKKLDNIQQDLRNEIINRLGADINALVSIRTLSFNNQDGDSRTVIKIDIPIAKGGPVIHRDMSGTETYYVRTGTSTDDAGLRAYGDAVGNKRGAEIA